MLPHSGPAPKEPSGWGKQLHTDIPKPLGQQWTGMEEPQVREEEKAFGEGNIKGGP